MTRQLGGMRTGEHILGCGAWQGTLSPSWVHIKFQQFNVQLLF
jgi:hypothetical protein